MNKFLLFSAVAMTAVSVGASPMRHMASVTPAPARTDIYDQIIYNDPEGELTMMNRSCDGFVTESFSCTHGPVVGSIVRMVEAEDGTVYLSHIASEYPVDTWIKAVRKDNTVVIDEVQPIYAEYDEWEDEVFPVYIVPMKMVVDEEGQGTFVATDDLKYVFNVAEDGTLTAADPEILLGVCVQSPEDGSWVWRGFGDRDITIAPMTAQEIVLPDNLTYEDWIWSDESDDAFVKVAIDGNNMYINGMHREMPEAWIKGTIENGKVYFPSAQYLGPDYAIFYYSFFSGAKFSSEENEEGEIELRAQLTDNAVFNYDAESKRIYPVDEESGYVINASAVELYPLYAYEQVTVGVQHRNPDAAPEAPFGLEFFESDWGNSIWFMLPNTDVDGNLLLDSNLFYEVYVDGNIQEFTLFDADWNEYTTTRIPYDYDDQMDFWVDGMDHTVYIYTPMEHNIGVRSVYINEEGKEIFSDMEYYGNVAVKGIDGVKEIGSVRYYDLQGKSVDSSYNGPVVRVSTMSDGIVVRSKIMR